ncbi:MAG: hypothetical protein JNL21_15040 [Myxococcales bacterium]|nr:hypothetical protein [Myxococcales bacterium]
MVRSFFAWGGVVALLGACSGTVVVEEGGGGGAGAGTGTTTTSSTKSATSSSTTTNSSVSVVSSSTGFIPCDEHADCGNNIGEDVCVFTQGVCAQRCGPGSPPCQPGFVCVDCATSSCPGCDDCLGACL